MQKKGYNNGQFETFNFDGNETEMEYYHEMMRWAYNMVTRSQGNNSKRCSLRINFWQVEQELHKLVVNLSLNNENNVEKNEIVNDITQENKDLYEEPILNPPMVRPMCVSNARLKGHFERRKKTKRRNRKAINF